MYSGKKDITEAENGADHFLPLSVLVVNYQGILYNGNNHRNGGRYYAEHESGYWMAGIDHCTSCD